MPRKASCTPDSRTKWRKRKRNSDALPLPSAAADHSDDSDSAADNDDDDTAVPSPAVDNADDEILAGAAARDPVPDLREAELLSSAEVISAFPAATRRTVNRPHPSVMAVVAAERSAYVGDVSAAAPPVLENISHGQLQVLSVALPDHPSLSTDPDKPSSYVCTPPPLTEGHGVHKQFQGRLHVVPKHSDWFSPGAVHRLERQVVPHFFTGKSPGHTPEKFIMLRNKIIAKYLENPGKRLAFAECQGFVVNTGELYDLSRIVRFLDTWGIINYLAVGLVHRGLRVAASLLIEEPAGELQLLTAPLKSIDGLVLFDRPKCSLQADDISSLASSSSNSEVVDFDAGAEFTELEGKIRERLSESYCSYCSQSLRSLHYQSQKERVDGAKDGSENEGDNWTDQETLLMLEGIEKHKDNWNSIADHVGTKSKAQCIYHFIRLPVEDSLLENIEVPDASMPFRPQSNGYPHSDSNGSTSGNLPQSIQHGNELPFISSSNPVMSLVAFLASAIGPRIAASCASAALSALTRDDDPRVISERMHIDDRVHGAHPNFCGHNGASSSISLENVKHATLCGLSAAAIKSKLFADQEEREIQRLVATVINHQLKRLELKLKQFAEVETLVLKECEQVERAKQRISAGRIQAMRACSNPPETSLPTSGGSTMSPNPTNISPRPLAMPRSMAEATVPAAYANYMQGQGHPQMPFVQRRPQMLSFGPRLPFTAIQTQPVAQAPNIMFSSGAMPGSVTPNHHPHLLRSSSSGNTTLG
ncbi:SWI/SNF complex subunit SWI3C homolog isoform X4 [Aegilops tauschii subsp. strangulata]|uniref:SWI/SNF complex subunit SWI3C n=1 Tax=Aegilops tauschii subsp. strangulata TaxID=200361 RepID=A0A453HIR1_AEGTS|nr:SWI/SNF complex subunit SWI3C homolog isoform X5 [Aegilops tauschii subsp. strangulata]